MFDRSSYVVPPRPTYTGPCTCVWPAEYARQRVRARIERETSAKADAVANPLGTLTSALPQRMLPGGFQGVEQRMEDAADHATKQVVHEHLDEMGRSTDHDAAYSQPGLGYGEYSEGDSEAGYGHASVMPKPGHIQKYNPKQEDPAVADARARNKAQAKGKLANKTKPDTLGRAAKKYFAKSSETKMRELTAYREDVVILLRSLIPETASGIGHKTITKNDTILCPSCMVTLTHYLYYSPTRFEPYLSETSTRAYLTLVDDSVASSHTQTPMESISHYELERVLRGELAAIEWRLAMKIARFHRKTDILNLFPVKVGEYAELRVNEQPPSHPEGVLKKTGKKILHTMGFGTGVTGSAHAAKEASSAMPSE
ncbi:hypothetical protein NliqN6_5025 [Naganishia liquefaciens]|uniref:Uncharacterized protein n=1 Tax=Naganishia liquefaciens TaxID=104408 RepID=A0A8H3TXG7_9TREE|nr:hypothetical protein NliqN6_5025 [Naganishia liquefaciens]